MDESEITRSAAYIIDVWYAVILVSVFPIVSWHWDGIRNWNPSSCKTMTCLSLMVAENLATKGVPRYHQTMNWHTSHGYYCGLNAVKMKTHGTPYYHGLIKPIFDLWHTVLMSCSLCDNQLSTVTPLECHGVLDCLVNSLIRPTSKKTS